MKLYQANWKGFNMNKIKPIMKSIQKVVTENKPAILISVGVVTYIGGMVGSAFAGAKTVRIMDAEKARRKKEKIEEPITPLETVKLVGKEYIAPVAAGIVGTACIISGHKANVKKNMALAAAYTVSESNFHNYKNKVKEMVGEQKAEEIKKEFKKEAAERADEGLSSGKTVIVGSGTVLFHDIYRPDTVFRSDIQTLRDVVVDLNYRMMSEMNVSYNDFWSELGLSCNSFGDLNGWSIDDGKITIDLKDTTIINGEAAIVVNWLVEPHGNYRGNYY